VREAKVYCEIHPWDVDDAFVRRFGAQGIDRYVTTITGQVLFFVRERLNIKDLTLTPIDKYSPSVS
jgi:hypothetical protein